MKTRKRWTPAPVAAILALILILNMTVPAAAVEYGAELDPNEKTYTQTFSDVPETHWAFEYIEEMVERGAISGYPDGKFYPSKIVTREEFAKIMVVAAGLTATPAKASSYADVPLTRWSSPFIETAKPYMTAYQSGGQLYFKPSDGALREDMAVAVVMLKGYDTRLADLSMINTMFKDVDAISVSAQPYVALAVENGIISGYNDSTFRGQATITRAEAAAILWRAFQYGSDNKVMPGEETGTTKPATTPKPGDTKPSEPEKEVKPFVAETLAKANISDTTMLITMDDDDDLIYYDSSENAILSLNPNSGEVETLLDVTTATCTGSDGLTYEGLTVNQVFWDDVASRLLVDGTFQSTKTEDGWETGTGNQPYSAIFTLKDGTLEKTFEKPNSFSYGVGYVSYNKLSLAMDDGKYMCSCKVHGMGNSIFNVEGIVDFSEDPARVIQQFTSVLNGKNEGLGVFGHYKMGVTNYNIYCIEHRGLFNYDYGTEKWVKVNDNYIDANAFDFQNSYFYTWGNRIVQIIRPSDGACQTKLNAAEDVEVLDMRALPATPDNLFVTTDEQYLFYDSAAKAIRVIRVNPEAN